MMKYIFALVLPAMLIMSSCYKDKRELLYPENDCDTTNVTYTVTIKPVINQYCAYSGCHAGAAPAGGMDFSTHAGLQAAALSGRLSGAVNQLSGFSAMPKGGAKLSDCTIRKIDKWIAGGALDN
jgi:hypothetical protein